MTLFVIRQEYLQVANYKPFVQQQQEDSPLNLADRPCDGYILDFYITDYQQVLPLIIIM